MSRSVFILFIFLSCNSNEQKFTQNNVGEKANDFVYFTPSGTTQKLYDSHADFTLIYFYNPGCPACKEMKSYLETSAVINSKIKSKNLDILAIYINKEEKLWRDHLQEMPVEWIQGRDTGDYLYKHKIYDLRAIPSLYLLDREKKVILKDVLSMWEVETMIKN